MIQNLWATPFSSSRMGDKYREDLINHILMKYDLNKPPSDFGKHNILNDEDESVIQFKNNVVLPAFNSFLRNTLGKEITDWDSYKMHGWLAGAVQGYNINYHNHRGSQLSAVFYLLCEEGVGGEITFTDPRQNSNRAYDASFEPWFQHLSIEPKSGDFVVFPSFLYHFVSTYGGNIRLAIPVDLFLFAND